MLGDGSLASAKREFEKKFREKSGLAWSQRDAPGKSGKYIVIELNYEDSDEEDEKPRVVQQQALDDHEDEEEERHRTPVQSKLPDAVQRLMQLIFNLKLFDNTLAALDYDANKMPLGKLSKKTLLKGYEVLKDLAALINDHTLATGTGLPFGQAVEQHSNLYFSLVPHLVGRNRLPILSDMDLIRVKYAMRRIFHC
jgi:poly [ADP-ribose] polymerase